MAYSSVNHNTEPATVLIRWGELCLVSDSCRKISRQHAHDLNADVSMFEWLGNEDLGSSSPKNGACTSLICNILLPLKTVGS